MVDEKLRKQMIDAYTNGDYGKALKLSRQLDKQIFSIYTGKSKPTKVQNKERNLQI